MSATPSLLVLIVEIESMINCPALISSDLNAVTVSDIIGSIVVFSNSYTLMHRDNKLVVIANMSDGYKILYPPPSSLSSGSGADEDNQPSVTDSNFLVPVHHKLSSELSAAFYEALNNNNDDDNTSNTGGGSSSGSSSSSSEKKRYFSNCLSTALTIINKQKLINKTLEARILVVQFDKDKALNYNSLMNCIFSGQKLDVMIDALILSPFESHFMQQACFLTGGLYYKHTDIRDMLQVLNFNFLSNKSTRKLLNLPLQDAVDFKASCHNHKKPVEYAFMCSVCLALTCSECEETPACTVCGTTFRTGVAAAQAGGSSAATR